jgi:prolyl-tRNA editing enzyme YbaK/EbsC (Cys-tRNA(Pro) deacylase)
VQDFLREKGFSFEVRELPGSTRTAQEAADSIGCEVAQIAKSLIFREKETNRVDLAKIESGTGLKLGKADANFVREHVGFAIGGIPPVAHNQPLETILNPDLKKYDVIWAAAGTPFAVFQLKPADLEPLTHGRWIELSETL